MKLAILGTRGVPPAYGGFETFAAELGTRLVPRGHDVTVYCRPERTADRGPQTTVETWNGIHRVVLPAIGHKYLETVSHSFLSALDALGRGFHAILVCNAANAFVLPLLRAGRIPVAINVDGIERKRRKWNALGRSVYAAGEAFSAFFANAVVADADVIAAYYGANYALDAVTIPYGAEFPEEPDSDVLERLGLAPRRYILYVSRFEPENNPLEVVLAYENLVGGRLPTGRSAGLQPGDFQTRSSPAGQDAWPEAGWKPAPPLVMVGAGLYAPDLVSGLHRHKSEKILFPGALYGRDYRTLQRNALVYIQATEVGGTHPALIEAMASGGCVLALDTPENREVGGDAIGYFRLGQPETLSGELATLLAEPGRMDALRSASHRRARDRFSWERVVDAYEALLGSLAGKRARR